MNEKKLTRQFAQLAQRVLTEDGLRERAIFKALTEAVPVPLVECAKVFLRSLESQGYTVRKVE